jgi:excisionase family DNA binding protein
MTPTGFNPADFAKGFQGCPAPQVIIHVRRGKRRKRSAKQVDGMLSVSEAAGLLGVSAKTVRRLYTRGEIAGAKIAGAVRIHRSSIDAYLSSHSNATPTPPATPAPTPKRRRRSSEGFRFLPPKG